MARISDMKQSSKKYFEHTCTNCRKSKVRCDRVYPRCGRCIRLDLDCVEQTRARGRPAKKCRVSSAAKIEEDETSVITSPPPSPPPVLPIEEHDYWTPIKLRLRRRVPKRVAHNIGRAEAKGDEETWASTRKKQNKSKKQQNGGVLLEVDGKQESEDETEDREYMDEEAENREPIDEEEQKDEEEQNDANVENWNETGFWEDDVEGSLSPDTRIKDFESTAFPEKYMATIIASVFMRLRNAGRMDREKSLCVLRAWSLTGVRMNMHFLVRSIHLMASVLDVEFAHLLSDCQLVKQLRGRYGINTSITESATNTLDPQHADPFINSYFTGSDAALIVISIDGLQRTTYNSLFANEYLHDCQEGEEMELEDEFAKWDEDDGKGSLLKRLILEESDRQDFLTTVGQMIFESPGPFAETSCIFKCQSRSYRSPYLCLAKLRFHISDAGSYYAAVLTLQPLPPCRYMGISREDENAFEGMPDDEDEALKEDMESARDDEDDEKDQRELMVSGEGESGGFLGSSTSTMSSSANGALITTPVTNTARGPEEVASSFQSPPPPQIFKFNSTSSAYWNSGILVAHHGQGSHEPSSVPPDPPTLFGGISSIAPIPSGGKAGGDKEGKGGGVMPWEGGSFSSAQGGVEDLPGGGGFSRMLQLIRGASELADEFLTL